MCNKYLVRTGTPDVGLSTQNHQSSAGSTPARTYTGKTGKQNYRRLSMDNELKDIADRLDKYGDGWTITNAQRNDDGSWCLTIHHKPTKEAANDNNK